jgi:two-component system, oxyanion-binding sensor
MSRRIRIGFLRLVDSAPVVVADADGLFDEYGLDVEMHVEPSWANIADKLTYGVLDAAVILPPLALAACAGLRGSKARLIVPLSLNQGGNAITVREEVASALVHPEVPARVRLLEWLHGRRERPRFAVVHTYSTHNLLLRYWLAAGGADPEKDIETVVIPPEDVGLALKAGQIDGFCAGAPWGDFAERQGHGRVLIGTSTIWPFHPEKCLCVSEPWAANNPELLSLLLRALLRAQTRCEQADQAESVARLLADPEGLNLPFDAVRAALPGGTGTERIRFQSRDAWFPARTHAEWFLDQMARWQWLPGDTDQKALARQVYRPDLLAPAVEAEGLCRAIDLPAMESTALLPMPDHEAFAPGNDRSRLTSF